MRHTLVTSMAGVFEYEWEISHLAPDLGFSITHFLLMLISARTEETQTCVEPFNTCAIVNNIFYTCYGSHLCMCTCYTSTLCTRTAAINQPAEVFGFSSVCLDSQLWCASIARFHPDFGLSYCVISTNAFPFLVWSMQDLIHPGGAWLYSPFLQASIMNQQRWWFS